MQWHQARPFQLAMGRTNKSERRPAPHSRGGLLGRASELCTGVRSWGHPLLPTQRAVGITLDYTALSDLIKGAFLHTG